MHALSSLHHSGVGLPSVQPPGVAVISHSCSCAQEHLCFPHLAWLVSSLLAYFDSPPSLC